MESPKAPLTAEEIAEIRGHVKTVAVLVRANDNLAYHRNNALRAYADRDKLLSHIEHLSAENTALRKVLRETVTLIKLLTHGSDRQALISEDQRTIIIEILDRAASALTDGEE